LNESLSKEELLRYSRHLLLPEVDVAGQLRIKNSSVLVVGAGGLGSPVILYLAAAGVGKIGIVDFDSVDSSNLQRQIIYVNDDVSKSKTAQAAQKAIALNPEIQVVGHNERLTSKNALEIISQYDLVIDGSDNFGTRYLVNDACVFLGKTNVYGSIYRFEGQASVFCKKDGPCYRCLFPDPPPPDAVPNCAEAGVLGVVAGVIGCIQATEALKLIVGIGESLSGRLMLYDVLSMKFDSLPIPKDPNCPVCGVSPRIVKLEDTEVACAAAVEVAHLIAPADLSAQLKAGKPILLLDVRSPHEVAQGKLKNSTNIPLQELHGRINELERNACIVTYCRSGMRSMQALEVLVQNGFKNVRSLDGGIMRWTEDALSIETSS